MSASAGDRGWPKQSAWILTFYAFKGGTGRTLALSNIARYLAESRGYRVGIVDLDIDSPGIPFEPLSGLASIGGTEESRNLPLQAQLIDDSDGFAELFGLASNKEAAKERIGGHVVALPSDLGSGALFVMPAAASSASRGERFRKSIEQLQGTIYALGHVASADRTYELLQGFVDAYSLDFVFIDGRTGVGSFFKTYAYSIPHALVLFMGLNDQNVSGSLGVLKEKIAEGTGEFRGEAPVFLVCSPVPTVGPMLLQTRLQFVEKALEDLRRKRQEGRKAEVTYFFELPMSVDYLLPYSDVASYRECYFPGEFPQSSLASKYVELAAAIEDLIEEPGAIYEAEDEKSSLLGALLKLETPIRIAAENISLEPLGEFFKDLGLEVGPASEDLNGQTKIRMLLEGRLCVELDLRPATDEKAVWEQAAGGGDSNPLPDIVLAPQSALASLVRNSERFLRLDGEGLEIRAISDTAFLDTWYPSWRRWCVADGYLWAVPFSMNTMLMAANFLLLEDFCAYYWAGKRANRYECPHPAFFPGNWYVLLDLLRSNTNGDIALFSFSGHGRSLYYEWLNVVLSFGGGDLLTGEGGVVLDHATPLLQSKGTVEGSLAFLTLYQETRRIDSQKKPLINTQMDDLLQVFLEGKLASYCIWTDAIRFERDGSLRPAAFDYRTYGGEKRGFAKALRLARKPRDVRFQRRPLIANWVALLANPNGTGRGEHARIAARVLRRFLEPSVQEELLKGGFPSPSQRVVERLRNRMPAADSTCFATFLTALDDAFRNGHQVPSHLKAKDWFKALRELLIEWIEATDRGNLPNRSQIEESLSRFCNERRLQLL